MCEADGNCLRLLFPHKGGDIPAAKEEAPEELYVLIDMSAGRREGLLPPSLNARYVTGTQS
jgi:hypothetical protein